jgi:hypothetical protein
MRRPERLAEMTRAAAEAGRADAADAIARYLLAAARSAKGPLAPRAI